MLDSWGSDLIVGLFAILFGSAFRVFMLISPEDRDQVVERREGESWWQVARRQADAGTQVPRSTKLAALALWGLLAVIWISIAVSPVEMRWLAFAAGFVLGLAILEIVYRLARRSGSQPPPPAPG